MATRSKEKTAYRREHADKRPHATARYIRMSPRKVKVVVDMIRGKSAKEAAAILTYTPKAACEPVLKVLNSAIANAENNFHMDSTKLYVSECFVCPGPTLKRIMPRAKGSADRILKRTSHVTMTVKERD